MIVLFLTLFIFLFLGVWRGPKVSSEEGCVSWGVRVSGASHNIVADCLVGDVVTVFLSVKTCTPSASVWISPRTNIALVYWRCPLISGSSLFCSASWHGSGSLLDLHICLQQLHCGFRKPVRWPVGWISPGNVPYIVCPGYFVDNCYNTSACVHEDYSRTPFDWPLIFGVRA